MDEYIEKHLYDVLLSIEETESYFEGRPKQDTKDRSRFSLDAYHKPYPSAEGGHDRDIGKIKYMEL